MSNWTDTQGRQYGSGNPPSAEEIQRQHQISTNQAEAIRQAALRQQQQQNKS